MSETNNREGKNDFSTTSLVLGRIEAESIAPYSKTRFILSRLSIWLLWLATVSLGALALSITAYAALSAHYAIYEATHTNLVTFFVDALPYVWVILFMLMVLVASVQLRQTKYGYKYSLLQIIGSSLGGSILLGAVFYALGLGFAFDNMLGRSLPAYQSMEKMERQMWQAPDAGRIVGSLKEGQITESHSLLFMDVGGAEWKISVESVRPRDVELLRSGAKVKLLGTSTSQTSFHVCAVFPPMHDRPRSRADMQKERREFDDLYVKLGRQSAQKDDQSALCQTLDIWKESPNKRSKN